MADRQARSCLILAGGHGGRVSELTRRICGDDRPVQFCPLFGQATPLEQTRERTAQLIPAGHTVVAVVKGHDRFYNRSLADLPPEHVITQPEDRGTTPATLYGLLRLAAIGAGGPVVVMPADHYVSDDGRFMAYVDAALGAVVARPDLVVLLGVKAESLELEYGWIEPEEPIPGRWSETLYRVRQFWEKPRLALGEELLTRSCFWSSFVMIGQPIVLATLIRRELPSLVERFLALRTRLAEPGDSDRVRQLYAKLGTADFSRQVLAARPPNLAVLPVTGLDWSDLNHPERAGLAMARAGIDLPSTSTSLPA